LFVRALLETIILGADTKEEGLHGRLDKNSGRQESGRSLPPPPPPPSSVQPALSLPPAPKPPAPADVQRGEEKTLPLSSSPPPPVENMPASSSSSLVTALPPPPPFRLSASSLPPPPPPVTANMPSSAGDNSKVSLQSLDGRPLSPLSERTEEDGQEAEGSNRSSVVIVDTGRQSVSGSPATPPPPAASPPHQEQHAFKPAPPPLVPPAPDGFSVPPPPHHQLSPNSTVEEPVELMEEPTSGGNDIGQSHLPGVPESVAAKIVSLSAAIFELEQRSEEDSARVRNLLVQREAEAKELRGKILALEDENFRLLEEVKGGGKKGLSSLAVIKSSYPALGSEISKIMEEVEKSLDLKEERIQMLAEEVNKLHAEISKLRSMPAVAQGSSHGAPSVPAVASPQSSSGRRRLQPSPRQLRREDFDGVSREDLIDQLISAKSQLIRTERDFFLVPRLVPSVME